MPIYSCQTLKKKSYTLRKTNPSDGNSSLTTYICCRRIAESKLDEFIEHSAHSTIKFTAYISPSYAEFINTFVNILSANTFIKDLFIKPMDSHNYWHYSTCHPIHTKNSPPYCQLICIKRICTKDEDSQKYSSILINHFLQREYPIDNLLGAQDMVRQL